MFLATHGILRSGGVESIPFTDTHSFDYDGLNDYVEISNPSAFYNTGDFSLSVWVKYTSTLSSRNIINLVDNKAVYISGGKLLGFFRNSGGSFKSISTSLNYNDGNWHNLVFTKDNTNLTLYVDGSQVAQNSLGGVGQTNGTNNARLGARGLSSPSNYFMGKSDEPAYFDYKLTSSDVTNIYGLGYPTDLAPLTPVGWWRAENATWNGSSFDIVDSGSGGNDAETNNMVEADRTTDVPLFDNKSFEYDGVNDYLDCGNDSSLNFSADDSFSFSVWFKKGSDSGSNTVFSKGLGAINYDGYYMFVLADCVYFRIRHNNSNFHQIKDNDTHPINTWVHYLVTYDGSRSASGGGLNLYKNGTLLTNVSKSGNFSSGSGQTVADFGIGARIIDSAAHFNGNINEVSAFNSELSQSDVTSIYSGGVPNDISSLNPLGHWRAENATFNGSKWTITDAGSGGNDAESISMTLASRSSDVPT